MGLLSRLLVSRLLGRQLGGGWYYPYPITYSYSTGSLLADMINLKNAPEGQKEKLTVVWNAYISGLLGGSGSLNVNRTTTAINRHSLRVLSEK